MANSNSNEDRQTPETLSRQIHDRVYSIVGILEQSDIPEDHPALPMVLGFATVLDERLSDIAGVESLTDQRQREAGRTTEDDVEDNEPVDMRPQKLGVDCDRNDYDALMLTLERMETLAMAVSDVVMHGEDRNIVSLASLIGSQIRIAERICIANSKNWYTWGAA